MRDLHDYDDDDQPDTPRWAAFLWSIRPFTVPPGAAVVSVIADHPIVTIGTGIYIVVAVAVVAREVLA